MEKNSNILNTIGYIWIGLVSIFILYRYIVAIFESSAPFTNTLLSFINFWNILFSLIVLMPSLICILAADNKWKNKNSSGSKP